MSDLVTHAVMVATYGVTRPDFDPILSDRRVRKQLQKAAGRTAVAALDTRPTAGLYFASLRLWAAADLPQVQRALGVEGPDTYQTLLELVVANVWSEYDSLVPDLIAISSEYFFAFSRNDTAATMSSARAFIERVWSGVTSEVVVPAHILLVAQMTEASSIDQALTGDRWSVAPAGWTKSNTTAPPPGGWANPSSTTVSSSSTPRASSAPESAHLPQTAGSGGHGAKASEDGVDLSLLQGSSFDLEGPLARKAADFALTFGVMLSDQLALDVGITPEGLWRDRAAVIGFCAALPAMAEAFGADDFLTPTTLVELARHVDVASGDGYLIQILAAGDPHRMLSECATALKRVMTDEDIEVSDQSFALFPVRLAESSDLARRVSEGEMTSPFE